METSTIIRLLPTLVRTTEDDFNVFDVMHHGTHEKQLSNVFAWLLDANGTHNLQDRFARIFLNEILDDNEVVSEFTERGYTVYQEVNTTTDNSGLDIADIVLENENSRIVIENYSLSDGHGHDYRNYLRYANSEQKQGIVVMLCINITDSALQDGWQEAKIITYSRLVDALHYELSAMTAYQSINQDAYIFLKHLHQKYGSGNMKKQEQNTLNFITAMCETGEAIRYQKRPQEPVASQFAQDMAEQLEQHYLNSRELLFKIKAQVKAYCIGELSSQFAQSNEMGKISDVQMPFSGIYQYEVYFTLNGLPNHIEDKRIGISFGPTAWDTCENNKGWKPGSNTLSPDYSQLFITIYQTNEIHQTEVGLDELLSGLADDDRRIHDQIIRLVAEIEA
jgi:uncharacterized membrane-anchored protein